MILFIHAYGHDIEQTESKVHHLYQTGDDDALVAYIQSLPKDYQYYYLGCLSLCGFKNSDSKLANFYFFKCLEITKNKTFRGLCYKAIGDSFYSGDGIDQSLDLAIAYYKKSADCSYAPGLFNYAIALQEAGRIEKAKYMLKKYLRHKDAQLKESAQKLLKEWQHDADSRK